MYRYSFLNHLSDAIHAGEYGDDDMARTFARFWNRNESATGTPRKCAIITAIRNDITAEYMYNVNLEETA